MSSDTPSLVFTINRSLLLTKSEASLSPALILRLCRPRCSRSSHTQEPSPVKNLGMMWADPRSSHRAGKEICGLFSPHHEKEAKDLTGLWVLSTSYSVLAHLQHPPIQPRGCRNQPRSCGSSQPSGRHSLMTSELRVSATEDFTNCFTTEQRRAGSNQSPALAF